jgi:hypothetical protein
VLVACGGVLGFLLAVDAFVAFLFVVMAALVSSGPPNPYVGAFAYLLLPVLVLFGLAAAWGAWEFWAATTPAGVERAGVVVR